MTATIVDVEPRVFSPRTGDRMRLVDAVENFLIDSKRGVVRISGFHAEAIAAVDRLEGHFGNTIEIGYDWPLHKIAAIATEKVVVVIDALPGLAKLTLSLAPWDDDDIIEYLLKRHPVECGSVLKRAKRCPAIWRPATAEGWKNILDSLAAHPSFGDPSTVIENHVRYWLREPSHFSLALAWAEADFVGDTESSSKFSWQLYKLPQLRHAPVFFNDLIFRRMILILGWIDDFRNQRIPENLRFDSRYELLEELARRFAGEPQTVEFLKNAASHPINYQSIVATLLRRVDLGWRPTGRGWKNFNGADLSGVSWEGIEFTGSRTQLIEFGSASLARADLRGAKLNHVFLRNANLEHIDLGGAVINECTASSANCSSAHLPDSRFHLFEGPDANFSYACLHRANFNVANLTGANFKGARLSESIFFKIAMNNVNLSDADLRAARLEQVSLMEAKLGGADFRDAYLELSHLNNCDFRLTELAGACFKTCWMQHCNLEAVEMPNAFFQGCDLSNAWLSDSVMPGANFRDATLFGAGLGAVNWENADLRGANLRCATFHFGSTRSGIVDSPYPSHGTRTGFYTDDFYDYPGKSVEEIRTANLCGADLRGAEIGVVDFYLVDLRDAKIDLKHLPHLRRCRAILS